MGWVSEIASVLAKLRFFTVVYQWQRGLYLLNGEERPRRIRPTLEQRLTLDDAERRVREEYGNMAFLPFRRPQLPQGYRQGRLLGLPYCTVRDAESVELRPGLYFHPPIFGTVVSLSIQTKARDLQNISVITSTDEPGKRVVMLSAILVYNVQDVRKAFVSVDDYAKSVEAYTIARISSAAMGKPYDFWMSKGNVANLQRSVLPSIRKRATDEWGVEIKELKINECVPHDLRRYVHDGIPPITLPASTD